MMKIYMYNTYFGDCFQIDEGDMNLIVDFGIHRNSYPYHKKKRKVYEDIIDYINGNKNLELLITHFHEDHISGLIYMKGLAPKRQIKFHKLYIPNIFSVEEDPYGLILTLLEELMKGFYLPNNEGNLCEFVKFLCGSISNIQLLERGDTFGQYTTLWPDTEYLSKKYSDILDNLRLDEEPFFRDIVDISKGIAHVINRKVKMSEKINVDNEIIETIPLLEKRLEKLQQGFELSKGKEQIINVNNFGNWDSIVFHNTEDCEKNILFTGDIDSSYMKRIDRNIGMGSNVQLHKNYYYIKIPHHGTITHYFDFYKYNPKVFMIPNGKCMSSAYKIARAYLSTTIIPAPPRPYMYCSNCNWCECWDSTTSCTCHNKTIIYSKTCREIDL